MRTSIGENSGNRGRLGGARRDNRRTCRAEVSHYVEVEGESPSSFLCVEPWSRVEDRYGKRQAIQIYGGFV